MSRPVSRPEELIADALRGIAEQAAVPRPMADAAWRAGRRRLAVMATSVAGAAVALAAAVAVLLAQAATTTAVGPAVSSAVPVDLQLRQVAAISNEPCPAHSHGLPGSQGPGDPVCVHVTGAGMTITSVQSAHVGISLPGLYRLSVRLRPADRRRFEALTRTLVGSPSPRDELAMISGGHVFSVVQVVLPIADGRLEIGSDGTRAHAEQVLQSIRVG